MYHDQHFSYTVDLLLKVSIAIIFFGEVFFKKLK